MLGKLEEDSPLWDEVESLDVESLDVESLDVESLDVESLDVESLDVESLDVESLDNDELIKKLHEDRLPINNIDEAIKENNLLFFIVKKFYKTNFKM